MKFDVENCKTYDEFKELRNNAILCLCGHRSKTNARKFKNKYGLNTISDKLKKLDKNGYMLRLSDGQKLTIIQRNNMKCKQNKLKDKNIKLLISQTLREIIIIISLNSPYKFTESLRKDIIYIYMIQYGIESFQIRDILNCKTIFKKYGIYYIDKKGIFKNHPNKILLLCAYKYDNNCTLNIFYPDIFKLILKISFTEKDF